MWSFEFWKVFDACVNLWLWLWLWSDERKWEGRRSIYTWGTGFQDIRNPVLDTSVIRTRNCSNLLEPALNVRAHARNFWGPAEARRSAVIERCHSNTTMSSDEEISGEFHHRQHGRPREKTPKYKKDCAVLVVGPVITNHEFHKSARTLSKSSFFASTISRSVHKSFRARSLLRRHRTYSQQRTRIVPAIQFPSRRYQRRS